METYPLRNTSSEVHAQASGSGTAAGSTRMTPPPPSGPAAADAGTGPAAAATPTVPFGRPMRALFNFAPGYTPLNHGSYGTFPRVVLEARERIQRDYEERPDTYKRFVYPELLRKSRTAVAPLLGAAAEEVVFVPNATTGVNTVLRNLAPLFEEGDVVLHFSSIYGACRKTIQSLEETTGKLRGESVEVVYPVEDDELVAMFRKRAAELKEAGKTVRVAMFDTIVSGPGVLVPWERLVEACREMGILSLVDGAHAIGHIDMTHMGKVQPDFLVTNCHKWLFTPRGCAVLYVPLRNQHLVLTTFPTSHGYEPPAVRSTLPPHAYFANLFVDVATTDNSAFLCPAEAIRFRDEVCGGEAAIRAYCHGLAREGGDRAAAILGTEVLDNASGSIRRCCFANVRLPLVFASEGSEGEGDGLPASKAQVLYDWMQKTAADEFDTYFQFIFYRDCFWVRLSAQVYLGVEDFEWGARKIAELCERVKKGEWKAG